jgi:hypothetical protein
MMCFRSATYELGITRKELLRMCEDRKISYYNHNPDRSMCTTELYFDKAEVERVKNKLKADAYVPAIDDDQRPVIQGFRA